MDWARSAPVVVVSSAGVFVKAFATDDIINFPYIGLDGLEITPFVGTPAEVVVAFPVSTTFTGLAIHAQFPPDPGNSIVFKINVNGVDSSGLVLTLADTNTVASASGDVTVAAGDLVCLSATSIGTPSFSNAIFTLQYN